MIDINPIIYNILSPICGNVENTFPPSAADFPCITFNVIDDSSAIVIECMERLQSVSVQIDVWDNSPTRQSCEATAILASSKMLAAGFMRSSAASIDEDGLHRKSMTFSAVFDDSAKRIYNLN